MPALQVSQTYTCSSSRVGGVVGATEYEHEYVVRMSHPTEGADFAVNAPGVPLIGDKHPTDEGAFVRRVTAQDQDGEPCLFRVKVYYSSEKDFFEDPLNAPPDIAWGFSQKTREMTRAKVARVLKENPAGLLTSGGSVLPYFSPAPPAQTGDPRPRVTNTAGMPYETYPEYATTVMHLSYARNQATYNALYYKAFANTLNNSAWYGFAPGTVYCNGIPGQRLRHPKGGYFWRVQFDFDIDDEGWSKIMKEQGYNYRSVDALGALLPFRDKDTAERMSEPQALTETGFKLDPAAQGADPNVRAVWTDWQPYVGSNFAALGIEL